jgi:hypothetical protein
VIPVATASRPRMSRNSDAFSVKVIPPLSKRW